MALGIAVACDMDPASVSSLRDLLPNGSRCASPVVLLRRRTHLFLRWELQSWERSQDRHWRDTMLVPKDKDAPNRVPLGRLAGLLSCSHRIPKVQDSAHGHNHCQDFSQKDKRNRPVGPRWESKTQAPTLIQTFPVEGLRAVWKRNKSISTQKCFPTTFPDTSHLR